MQEHSKWKARTSRRGGKSLLHTSQQVTDLLGHTGSCPCPEGVGKKTNLCDAGDRASDLGKPLAHVSEVFFLRSWLSVCFWQGIVTAPAEVVSVSPRVPTCQVAGGLRLISFHFFFLSNSKDISLIKCTCTLKEGIVGGFSRHPPSLVCGCYVSVTMPSASDCGHDCASRQRYMFG